MWLNGQFAVGICVPRPGIPFRSVELAAALSRLCSELRGSSASAAAAGAGTLRLKVVGQQRDLSPHDDISAVLREGAALAVMKPRQPLLSSASSSSAGGSSAATKGAAAGASVSRGSTDSYAIHVLLGGSYLMRVVVKPSFTIKQLKSVIERKHAELTKPLPGRPVQAKHKAVSNTLPPRFALSMNGSELR